MRKGIVLGQRVHFWSPGFSDVVLTLAAHEEKQRDCQNEGSSAEPGSETRAKGNIVRGRLGA